MELRVFYSCDGLGLVAPIIWFMGIGYVSATDIGVEFCCGLASLG